MKLYFSKGTCSLGVRITVHELNLPCEFESVDLKTKKTGSGEDYLKINPKGPVPALQLDNQSILTENCVIQQYLADQYAPNTMLPPMGNFKRYQVLEWLNFISTDLHKGASPLFSPDIPDDVKEKVFKPKLVSKLNFLENHLANKQTNQFLTGNDFTIADSYLFVILFWLPKLNITTDKLPNIQQYFEKLKNHKSVRIALEEEGFK